MKSKFYLLLLVPALMLSSCTKWIPDTQANIVGNWELVSVERYGPYGSEPIYSEYEYGEFYFGNNGTARYSDNYGQMDGSWRLIDRSDGYHDYYGNYRTGARTSMELRLYDYYDSRVIEWEFYSIELSGNHLVGYMNRFGYDYRYEFRRY
ncbi:MAG TPA: hypothetical protein VD993_03915 [Chitinophagaceae bacterium]|nr:hypothetical protein [Chitinophagaceae bacterium]